jgi:hypothetical protein
MLLLKPEDLNQSYIDIEVVIKHATLFGEFDALGVTEKELGDSTWKRMLAIARLRQALSKKGIEIPIQIFGSLDTLSTPLYYIAGADIFDGLTWLRFAYTEGYTAYRYNYGVLELGIEEDDDIVEGSTWKQNLYYIRSLSMQMAEFAATKDFKSFKHHSNFLNNAYEKLKKEIGE